MTDRIDEFDTTQMTTGVSNWLGKQRDAAMGAVGNGRAVGRHTTRLVANKLYKNWTNYLGSQGLQGTGVELSAFISRYWPSMTPALQQAFPNILPPSPSQSTGQPPPPPPPPPPAAAALAAPPAAPVAPPAIPTEAEMRASGIPPARYTATQHEAMGRYADWQAQNRAAAAAAAPTSTAQADLEAQMQSSDDTLRDVRAAGQQKRESRKIRGRLIEADPSLNIPQPPSPVQNGRRRRQVGQQPAQAGAPPAFLTKQINVGGVSALNRAQVDQVMYKLAQMLIDQGNATVGPRDQPPQSAAGKAMAGSGGGFGRPNTMRTLQTPITAAAIKRAEEKARVSRGPETDTLLAVMAAEPNGMPLTTLLDKMARQGTKISPTMMKVLLYASEFA